jgi:hypothetical protein
MRKAMQALKAEVDLQELEAARQGLGAEQMAAGQQWAKCFQKMRQELR